MKQVNIPDSLEVKFTAKEVGGIRDYLSNNFIHSKVVHIISFIEQRMIEANELNNTAKTDDNQNDK